MTENLTAEAFPNLVGSMAGECRLIKHTEDLSATEYLTAMMHALAHEAVYHVKPEDLPKYIAVAQRQFGEACQTWSGIQHFPMDANTEAIHE